MYYLSLIYTSNLLKNVSFPKQKVQCTVSYNKQINLKPQNYENLFTFISRVSSAFAGNIVYAEAQQEKRVTGTVTSEGEPLPGVSVQLKGASSGTITDIDGKYSTEVPATGTLVFRFVGMRTVEQPVNNRSVINVTLESESKELEEVMVVAYATAKSIVLPEQLRR